MGKNTGLLAGIISGAAAGIVIGILIAPEKGSDSRKKLKKMFSDCADALGDYVHAAREKMEGVKEEVEQTDKHLKAALGENS